MNDVVRYGSVRPPNANDGSASYADALSRWFSCPTCHQRLMLNRPQMVAHLAECGASAPAAAAPAALPSVSSASNQTAPLPAAGDPALAALRRPYFCDACQQQLHLTPTEVLRHRMAHKAADAAV